MIRNHNLIDLIELYFDKIKVGIEINYVMHYNLNTFVNNNIFAILTKTTALLT